MKQSALKELKYNSENKNSMFFPRSLKYFKNEVRIEPIEAVLDLFKTSKTWEIRRNGNYVKGSYKSAVNREYTLQVEAKSKPGRSF